MDNKPQLHPRSVLIAGPTTAGKSEVAMLLAERFTGEIISVDSMQVYRGLDIGTAKPTPADRARVPHHLIDVVDPAEPFDAARFLDLARQAAVEIQSRHRVPILCGGTGLYFKAFLEGLGAAPPANPALRAELAAVPLSVLLQELAERDPATFERIDRQNPRRVIRAIEVIRLTGRPFSEQRARWGESQSVLPPPASVLFGLMRSNSDLHERIGARVEEMFRRGLVEETEQLLKRGLAENKTAMQALGYRQVTEHLQGKRSLAETTELVKLRTRQFAKRQITWFKRQIPLSWLTIQAGEPARSVADRIAAALENR
jgi:tRNA dimethylallyltransferase